MTIAISASFDGVLVFLSHELDSIYESDNMLLSFSLRTYI